MALAFTGDAKETKTDLCRPLYKNRYQIRVCRNKFLSGSHRQPFISVRPLFDLPHRVLEYLNVLIANETPFLLCFTK